MRRGLSGTGCELTRKTTFGVCKTLCDIVDKISERLSTNQTRTPYFKEYVTNMYKLSCFKSVTNVFFVLNTRIDNLSYSDVLKQVYESIYIDYVKKNALFAIDAHIDSEVFRERLIELFVKLHKAISTK